MKIKVVLCFIVMLFIASSNAAHAQDAATDTSQSEEQTTQPSEDRLRQRLNSLQSDAQQRRQDLSNEVEQRREEFRNRLQNIRDDTKKVVVQRIDANIAKINASATSRLSDALSRLSSAITRIEEKAQSTQTQSQEVTDAISAAKASIQAAQAEVDEQASISYIIEITDEEALQQAVSTVVQQFKSDLAATKRSVLQAKSDTLEAARLTNT